MRVPDDDLPSSLQPSKVRSAAVPIDDLPDFAAAAPKRTAIADTGMPLGVGAEFGGTTEVPGEPEKKVKYTDIVNRDDLFNIANKTMKAYGEPTFNPQKETKADFVERFYTQQRWATTNDVSIISLVNSLKNSQTDTARDLAAGLRLFNEAEDSPKIGSAFIDYAAAVGLSPSSYLGFGAGKIATAATARAGVKALAARTAAEQTAARTALETAKTPAGKAFAKSTLAAIEPGRQAAKAAIEKKATRAGIGTSIVGETAAAAASNIQSQRGDIEARRLIYDLGETVPEEVRLKEEEYKTDEEGNVLFDQNGKPIIDTDINWVRVGVSAAIASTLSGVGVAATTKPRLVDRGELIDKELKRRNIEIPKDIDAPQTTAEKEISKALSADFDATVSQLIKDQGRQLLDEYDPATALTDSKIKNEFVKTSTRVALNILKQNPEAFGYTGAPDQKISDAIYRVLTSIDEVDDIGLERAITQAGVSLEDFAKMNLTTASEAGRNLQSLSVAKKAANKIRQIDPALDERLRKLYSAPNGSADDQSLTMSILRRGDRETKALVVSGIDTTTRNTIGNSVGLTLKAATDLIEGSVYSIGRAAKAIGADKGAIKTLNEGMGDAFAKSIGTFMMIRKSGLAEDITENLLQNNPTLLRKISSVTEDVDTENISWLSRWANTLNSGMDGLFRRASFVASVESQLRDLGLDLYKDVLAKNKEVPKDVLKRAIDDSFKDTFSYTPNEFAKSFSSFEDQFERAGSAFVKAFEFPVLSLIVTFPRFVTNAIAFQYKYSPVGLVGASQYLSQAQKARKAGDNELADSLTKTGVRKSIEASLGMAALLAAVDYREKNQDINYNEYKTDSGTVDLKPVYPFAPYLAVGDIIVKVKNQVGKIDYKGVTESLIGFKAPAGTQNVVLENAINFFTSDEKRAEASTELGKIIGDYFGRAVQPFFVKQIFDLLDIVRGDEALKARDPNLIESETASGKMVEAALERVQAKLPVVKEELPAAIPRMKDVTETSKEGEFINRIVGFRVTPNRSDIEKEMIKAGVDVYKTYSRPSGDKDFDRLAIERTNRYAIEFVERRTSGSEYEKATPTERATMIENEIRRAAAEGKRQAEMIFAENFPEKLSRINYLSLSASQKKIVNERYAKENNGRTMEDDKAYDQLKKYSDFSRLDLRRATGGLIEQTESLFRK